MRLPRGRHARPRNNSDAKSNASADEGVNERLRRLEALVDRRGSETAGNQPPSVENSCASAQAMNQSKGHSARPSLHVLEGDGAVGRRQGPHRQQSNDFWYNLVEDVSPLPTVTDSIVLIVLRRRKRRSFGRWSKRPRTQ